MMKLTQKKTCFGCKALTYQLDEKLREGICRLGYETGVMIGAPNETLPVEPCPKPTTKDDWNTAQIELRKGATLGVWLKDKPITLTFSHQDILLILRAMCLSREHIPQADEIIKRLQEVI